MLRALHFGGVVSHDGKGEQAEPIQKKNNDSIRRFTAGVKMIDLDAATRILIPKDLLSIASLNKPLVLSSAINMIEIWDKELYEKAIDDATLDFAELAEEVMEIMMRMYHKPVLLDACLEGLALKETGTYVDVTLVVGAYRCQF